MGRTTLKMDFRLRGHDVKPPTLVPPKNQWIPACAGMTERRLIV